jgi:serine/threonine-protein kinase
MNAVNPAAEAATPKSCPSCGARYAADALFCSLDGSPLTTSPGAIAAAAATDPYVGREILGHIEIRQLVGIGAMGRVYRAFQKGIDRDVAVKILHRELSANQMLVARFHREAKVASRLAHPNVVHVLLTGQLPDGALYIVMEYLDGMSLQSALAADGGAMPLPRTLHIALQLCDAAGEAHAQGIVHRDLKPENVMLVKRADDPDYVKILDFGIARLNWGEQSMATAAGLIFGTARYISPEAAQGEKVAPQGDVYSIATMVYQMLSARTPFDADQAVALLVQQIHDPPPPLKSIERAAYVPDPIASVVMQNLAKKTSERADNARVLGRALLEAAVASGLSAQDILARPGMLGAGRGQHTSVVQMPSMQKTNKLQLEPEVASRIGAKTAYEPPGDTTVEPPAEASRTVLKTEVPDGGVLPPGSRTTKWHPPADFEAKLVPPVPRPPPSAPPSGVDLTMDDSQIAPPSRAPLPTPAPSPSPSQVRPPMPTPRPDTAPPMSRTAPPMSRTAPPMSRTAPPASRPPSMVESTMAGDEVPDRLPRTNARFVTVLAACFLVGVLIMGGILVKAGLIGSHARDADYAALATDAAAHQQWETVRDLTDKGLARAPRDAQLLHIRAQASTNALAGALVKRDAGDTAGALRLAKVAAQLDPASAAASTLVDELTAGPEPAVAVEPAIPPLSGSRGAPSSAAAGSASGARATVDVSNAKPAIGQPVDLAARVLSGPHPKIEGPAFHIAGPGIAPGTRLEASDDGSGVYRATFTFLQSGRFDVSFTAKVDGGAVKSARAVVVGETKSSPPPLPPSSAPAVPPPPPPATAPTGSVRWM